MSDNRFECGCERGGDCTKTTMCALQSALEDKDVEIERLRAALERIREAADLLQAKYQKIEMTGYIRWITDD